MFRTVNMDVINECRLHFDFMLPRELLLIKRKSNFLRKFNSCSSIVCHFGKCVKCVTIIYFLLVKLIKFFPLSFYILLPVMVNKGFQTDGSNGMRFYQVERTYGQTRLHAVLQN